MNNQINYPNKVVWNCIGFKIKEDGTWSFTFEKTLTQESQS